jgi:hypothetical protein
LGSGGIASRILHLGKLRVILLKIVILKQFWSEKLKGIEHLEDLGVDGRIILE